MAGNKYTGEVTLDLAGVSCTLVYDWRALADIQSKYGEDAFDTLFEDINGDFEKLADILAAGLRRHHPEMTAAAVMEASPALLPVREAVHLAILAAFLGPEKPKKGEGADATDKPEKKTVWPLRLLSRFVQACRRMFSGG